MATEAVEAENGGGNGASGKSSGASAASLVASNVELDAALASVASTKSAKALVVHFRAQWCSEPGDAMAQLLAALSSHFPFQVVECDAEAADEVALRFEVEAVPYIAILGIDGSLLATHEGLDALALRAVFERVMSPVSSDRTSINSRNGDSNIAIAPQRNSYSGLTEGLKARISRILDSAAVLLFMKGTPSGPRCGFSRKAVAALNKHEIPFQSFDILEDEAVRQGVKEYCNWPTYPQLYVNGELLGGWDIIESMDESGTFKQTVDDMLGAASAAESETIEKRLEKLVNRQRIMLFMKGSPDEPRCGFSRKAVDALRNLGLESDSTESGDTDRKSFGHFDILLDEDVRQGLKEYSRWPTYPQLYCGGELIGGSDIILELAETGELASALGV